MLEVINDVLNTEERAEKIVQEARDAAARIRNEFAEEESRAIRERQAAADQKLREGLSAVREEEERRKAEADAAIREADARFAASTPDGIDEAISRAVAIVMHGPSVAQG